jgi:UDP-perosamine 4-acetyltransferase
MNAKIKIVGLGAGGHAKVMLEVIQLYYSSRFEMVGFLDVDKSRHRTKWRGYDVLGGDEMLPELARAGVSGFFVGLGSIGNLASRIAMYGLGESCGLGCVSLAHPQSVVSGSAILAEGSCIMAGALVGPDTRAGKNTCINTGAIVEHDCIIGDHSFVGPGATLSGSVRVGESTFIGAGAVVRQQVRIGSRVIVGAGAVVVGDVPEDSTVVGVPARKLIRHE